MAQKLSMKVCRAFNRIGSFVESCGGRVLKRDDEGRFLETILLGIEERTLRFGFYCKGGGIRCTIDIGFPAETEEEDLWLRDTLANQQLHRFKFFSDGISWEYQLPLEEKGYASLKKLVAAYNEDIIGYATIRSCLDPETSLDAYYQWELHPLELVN